MKNLKGTWPQAIRTFLFPLIILFLIRWALFEPFVIPSGSMIPQLLVHDHILVQKFSYGLKWPFSDAWMFLTRSPERGQVVVFKYPLNPDVYYIKRLIGLPGDIVSVVDGRITVNGQPWKLEKVKFDGSFSDHADAREFEYHQEILNSSKHWVRFLKSRTETHEENQYVVPQGKYFFMGDNRDQSSDGRVWGFVEEKWIVGQARWVWLSCEKTLSSAPFVCDPTTIRWKRLFTGVQ